MCRFVLYLGRPIPMASLVTEPEHSLILQSYKAEERIEPLNGDGFGVSWFPEDGAAPAAYRSISPAWNDANLADIARVVRSRCLLAHVRAATPGLPVIVLNCHPFVHDGLAFMHNGDVGGFRGMRRRFYDELSEGAFQSIRGSTDSEHVFALFRDVLATTEAATPALRMARALATTVQRVAAMVARHDRTQHCTLNLAVSDGTNAVVTRYTNGVLPAQSLHVRTAQHHDCVHGPCATHEATQPDGPSTLVSSEPLSDSPGWRDVAVGHMVVADADGATSLAIDDLSD